MKYLILTLVLLFTACSNNLDCAKQQTACENHDGVFDYASFSSNSKLGAVVCNDGATIEYNEWSRITGLKAAKALSKISK